VTTKNYGLSTLDGMLVDLWFYVPLFPRSISFTGFDYTPKKRELNRVMLLSKGNDTMAG